MAEDQSTAVSLNGEPSVEYRDIPGFPGYRVGSDGSVWSLIQSRGREWRRKRPGRVGKLGHLRVVLHRDGKGYDRQVHRIVLETFVGPCPDGMEACHFPDRNPANNRLDNLRRDTPAANQADRVRHGTSNRGERCGSAKLTEADVRAIRSEPGRYGMYTALARRYGVSPSAIKMIILRERWAHVV